MLQVDESTDVRDAVKVIVYIRMVFRDWSVKEKMPGIITLKERTRGIDIYNEFKTFCLKLKLPLSKLVSITIDGAKLMVGSVNGFVALCQKDNNVPSLLKYHCIIHQQVLCGIGLNTEDVMSAAFKITNSARAKAFQRFLFRKEFDGQ